MRRLLLAISCSIIACGPPPEPFELAYTVFPTVEGADVAVRVSGGSQSDAWVAFGVGPGVPASRVTRVHSLSAHRSDGTPLTVTGYRDGGFHIEEIGKGAWTLTYALDLRADGDDDVFYRSSVRDDHYLVLVGSDAFARFGTDATMVLPAPEERPSGALARASVTFRLPEDDGMPWRVVTTAPAVTPSSFELEEHPVGSVFALGPINSSMLGGTTGMRVGRHRDWRVLAGGSEPVEVLLASLREALASRLGGVPGDDPALALLLPLPRQLRPRGGLRTSGMVRGNTMLLYADAPAVRPESVDGIRSAMAVFLGHELFHLYVPTNVTVGRELSWLSEGWAMHLGRAAAVDAGWLTEAAAEAQVEQAYRRYLEMGGYRAGSLPQASMGSESQRDLLYLRGELVFRFLERQWDASHDVSLDRALWDRLVAAYQVGEPLGSPAVEAILGSMFDEVLIRRYVAGQAPLTQGTLGFEP